MENAVEVRAVARRKFTISYKKLEALLSADDKCKISTEFCKLEKYYSELSEAQNKVTDLWINKVDRDEIAFTKDLETADDYETQWFSIKNRVKNILGEADYATPSNQSVHKVESCSGSFSSDKCQHRIRLPKIELPKFDGNIKNWLSFWTQFKKIHSDKTIDKTDKFRYLLQSMEPGSKAQTFIESFPPTEGNYDQAIEQMKSRFARDEMIIQHYVRELLQLVLAQAKSPLKAPFSTLFDKIMTQILALESLGVTQDTYGAFLFPLVESALPEDILRAWSRSPGSAKNLDSSLSNLLCFLRQEVESDENIRLARSGFCNQQLSSENPPTACFTTNDKKASVGKERKMVGCAENNIKKSCVWCEKDTHPSSECIIATNKTLEERREYLKKRNICFSCLIPGHLYHRCMKRVKCVICSRRHYPIMCNKIPTSDTTNSLNQEQVMNQDSTSSSTVLLQTLKLESSVDILNTEALVAARSFTNLPVLLKVCSLCEAKDGPFLNIFDADKVMAKKIESVMPFGIAENDLPHKICFRCSVKIEELYKFIQKCMNTQENIRKALGNRGTTAKTKHRELWEERFNQSNISNDDCDALIKKAMEGIKYIALNSLPLIEEKTPIVKKTAKKIGTKKNEVLKAEEKYVTELKVAECEKFDSRLSREYENRNSELKSAKRNESSPMVELSKERNERKNLAILRDKDAVVIQEVQRQAKKWTKKKAEERVKKKAKIKMK